MVAALAAILYGIGVLESYSFGLEPLLPFGPFLPPTQPLAAILLLLVGTGVLALRFSHARVQLICGAAAATLAAVVLLEYLLGARFGIDTLLFGDAVRRLSRVFPGRPAPLTALGLLLLALLLLAGCWHSQLGVQVVVEDYVRGGLRMATLIASAFLHVLLGVLGVLAIVRLALGTAS
jgi:hypothetical protein